MEEQLQQMQKKVNELYAKEGLTDEVLIKQVMINTFRYENNIPDTEETVYKEFVQ